MSKKLEEARKIINEVDSKMAQLFVKRMRAAEMVYEYKKEFGLPILDSEREAEVIKKNTEQIEDDILKGYYIDYLRHMMAISRAYQYRLQKSLKVAYSGMEGAFVHTAAGRLFPESNRVSCRGFKAAYDSVVKGECDVAFLPIDVNYTDEVGETIDLIFSGSLFINGIYRLDEEETNTSTSVAEKISTRFAVLSRVQANSPGLTNSVLMFTLKHEAGSPANVIGIIEKYGYNMTPLRSRPLKQNSLQYYYYTEIDGTIATDNGAKMIDELNKVCDRLKVAGTFAPQAEI